MPNMLIKEIEKIINELKGAKSDRNIGKSIIKKNKKDIYTYSISYFPFSNTYFVFKTKRNPKLKITQIGEGDGIKEDSNLAIKIARLISEEVKKNSPRYANV